MDDAKDQGPVRMPGPEEMVAEDAEGEAFIQGLIARGEAVRLLPGQALPSGATHEIVATTPDGRPILRRRRMAGRRAW